jgi:hypothetical protein
MARLFVKKFARPENCVLPITVFHVNSDRSPLTPAKEMGQEQGRSFEGNEGQPSSLALPLPMVNPTQQDE